MVIRPEAVPFEGADRHPQVNSVSLSVSHRVERARIDQGSWRNWLQCRREKILSLRLFTALKLGLLNVVLNLRDPYFVRGALISIMTGERGNLLLSRKSISPPPRPLINETCCSARVRTFDASSQIKEAQTPTDGDVPPSYRVSKST